MGKFKDKRPFGSVDERMIIKCVFEKQDGVLCAGLLWLRTGTVDRLL